MSFNISSAERRNSKQTRRRFQQAISPIVDELTAGLDAAPHFADYHPSLVIPVFNERLEREFQKRVKFLMEQYNQKAE